MKHRRVTFLRSHPLLAVVAAVIGLAGSGAIASGAVQRSGSRPPEVALVYFDSPNAPKGDTRPDSSPAALREFRRPAESTTFSVTL